MTEYLDKAKAAFRFNMSFVDPSQDIVGEINVSTNFDRLSEKEKRNCTVQGILFYYPHVDGKETRPVVRERKVASVAYDEGLELEVRGRSQPNRATQDDIDEFVEDFGIDQEQRSQSFRDLDVYWVNRFVPQSYFGSIPLFPKNMHM